MGLKPRNLNKCLIILSVFLFFIFCVPFVCAEDYYADVDISVDKSGFVTIDGSTNHPDLLVENVEVYISKEKSFWLLNITKDEVFSDFIFTLTLPEDSSINYVKSSGYIGIEEDQGNLVVKGFGENTNLSVMVQYQIEKNSEVLGADNVDVNIVLLIIILVLIVLFIIVYFFKDTDKNKSSDSFDDDSLKGLNMRQKDIMKILIESEVPLTQTDIQKELGIPKASVSRNVRRLELKGLIEKEKLGMSNVIRLKEK